MSERCDAPQEKVVYAKLLLAARSLGGHAVPGYLLSTSADTAHWTPHYNRRMHAAFANKKMVRVSGGFTLIEIMVVIVILGVLAALVVPRVLERPDEARAIAAKSDIATILQALKLYRLDNQRYPTGEQGLAALIAKPEQPPIPPNWKPGGYLEKVPKDPWGRPFVYVNPGVKGEIEVFSFGADGQQGGVGIDADIGSWDL